jgi:hypothetical protein
MRYNPLTVMLQDSLVRFCAIPLGLIVAAGVGVLFIRPSFMGWVFTTSAAIIAAIGGAIWFVYKTKAYPAAHIYVKHVASDEWAYYPPYHHPVIPFRDLGYSVIPFEYEWKEEAQEIQLYDEGRATVSLSWRPDTEDLRSWIESNREERIEQLRRAAARDAKHSFGLLVKGLKRDDRESIVGKPLPLVEEHLGTGRGIELKDYALVITQFPEPQPAPPPQEPWEGYDELHIGDRDGKAVFLDDDDQVAHIQIIGASRFGKSKLVEYAMRQLIGCEGVIAIDPNQQLYDDFLTWCVHRDEAEGDVRFLDPSDENSQIGFNPFLLDGERTPARISARAARLLKTSLKSMGFKGDGAVLAERIMSVLFYVVIEQKLPITDLNAFMVPRLFDRRDEIMANCQSQEMRDEWEMLTSGKKADAYVSMMQSSATRLVKLFLEPGVKRILTNPLQLNLSEIVRNGYTLIVNLKDTPDILSLSARDIIGTFLVDEIWSIMKGRTKAQAENLPHLNFVIDEFHNFATPEFAIMLMEGAKYGLHLWLINHALDRLDGDVRSALNACHTRIAFGRTSQKDAAAIMEGSRPAKGNELRDEISRIPRLDKRMFMLSRAGKRNMICNTPWVQEFPVKAEAKRAYLEYLTQHREEEPTETPEAVAESQTVVQNEPQEPAKPSPPKASAPPKQPGEVETDDFYH